MATLLMIIVQLFLFYGIHRGDIEYCIIRCICHMICTKDYTQLELCSLRTMLTATKPTTGRKGSE